MEVLFAGAAGACGGMLGLLPVLRVVTQGCLAKARRTLAESAAPSGLMKAGWKAANAGS